LQSNIIFFILAVLTEISVEYCLKITFNTLQDSVQQFMCESL